ncbi:efflux RND transporter periplasmic adaptor subunit [Geomicrobium sp. JCM 19039]|uniref:efflux RND transporter periplasmic adaptor subunit n=1 Tax=Geomicrobium sp. JCM 19039 TaxID=1460636 RepID=UPI00045F1F5C|nr:efflux RND transporter periplasmic adaptor subunit [Geomicrobium sp. JCM 19039]GAK13571.1 periplasmic component of efflux system [Geomicrobium sp. JCM 19039]
MKKRIGILIGVILLAGLIVGNSYILNEGLISDDPVVVDTVTATEETLYESIIANGIVEPLENQSYYEEAQHGTLTDIHVEVGDQVQEGDLLMTYEDEEMARQIVTMRNSLDRLMLEIEQYDDRISSVETDIANERNQANDEDEEDPFNQSDQLISQLQSERDNLEFQRRTTNLQYSEQQEELEYYEGEEFHEVYSDVPGTVTKRISPDMAAEGESLIHIQSEDQWTIQGTVTEYDLVQLTEGMEVEVEPNVMPGDRFSGTLTELGTSPASEDDPLLIEEANVTSYPYEILLEEGSEELLHGFHVNAYFEIEAESDAVLLPEHVIELEVDPFTQEEMQYVYVIVDGLAMQRLVETGVTSEQGTQMISGVTPGDSVIDPSNLEMIYEGMEVILDDSPEES